MKKPRSLILTLLALLLVVGIPIGFLVRKYREERLNHDLIAAIRRRDALTVQLLLRQGADPNARDLPKPIGTFLQQLLAMIEQVRHPEAKPSTSDFPSTLMVAVEEDDTQITLALLGAGAKDVNARIEKKGTTYAPLIVIAAGAGNVAIVKALLNKGADIEAHGDEGETALVAAMSLDRDSDQDSDPYSEPLHETDQQTVEQKQMPLVRLLLERGANIQAADSQGWTALGHAVAQDNAKLVAYFLERGANPNVQCGSHPKTPIAMAARHYNITLIKTLLQKGAKIELPDAESPLLQNGDRKLMVFLLDHGANINARFFDLKYMSGTTLLMCAARFGEDEDEDNRKEMLFLLTRGADINARVESEAGNGATALMYAAQYMGPKTVCFLLDHGANINMNSSYGPALLWAIEDSKFDSARLLVRHGADVNLAYGEGTTALIKTAMMGNDDFARELLQRGADVNAADKEGQTALHIAAGDNDSMVELLLDWGANVNARDKDGHTPLYYALKNNHTDQVFGNQNEDYGEVIAILRKAGAKTGKELDAQTKH